MVTLPKQVDAFTFNFYNELEQSLEMHLESDKLLHCVCVVAVDVDRHDCDVVVKIR